MRYRDARSMLGLAFGPGELAQKINEKLNCADPECNVDEDAANELMNWMAEELTDEEGDDGQDQERKKE